jgi:hypothetical protein
MDLLQARPTLYVRSLPLFGGFLVRTALHATSSLISTIAAGFLVSFISVAAQEPNRASRQLPAPTDVDPRLTETLGQLEQRLGDVALHGFKDTQEMERLVGPEFTLRTSDAPERSVPRPLWGQPSSTYKMESLDERSYAARKLADDLAVVSLLLTQKASRDGRDRSGDFYVVDIWKQRGDRWQLIARYSSPLGKTFDRMPPH